MAAATNTIPLVRQLSGAVILMYVLEQHKGPGRGDARDLWLRSSVGWSGARN